METLLQDLRYALRQLIRNPGFAAVAILTLALGIGANTAIFSVLDSIMLQPLPFANADRLVQIDAQTDFASFPKGWIREYQRRATTFSSISALHAERRIQRRWRRVLPTALLAARSAPICSTLSECSPRLAASFARRKKILARTAWLC